MGDYIAFLRGINLGRRRVKMDELRGFFEQLKFTRVATFIASGNVLFSDRTTDTDALRGRMEQDPAKVLGCSVDVFPTHRHERRLPDADTTGLIPANTLPGGPFVFENALSRFVNRRSKRVFKIGDQLQVHVCRVDAGRRMIDFAPV